MKLFSFIFILFSNLTLIAQTRISGQVVDVETGYGLDNVSITEKTNKITYFTDENGYFEINLPNTKGSLILKKENYYATKITYNTSSNLGIIKLTPEPIQLSEIELSSNLINAKKQFLLGQHLPIKNLSSKTLQGEITKVFKTIPSAYVSAQGGGMGDGKMSVRGFDPSQTAIFINGIQINDMETGWVYWSNWSGLSEIAQQINFFSGLYNGNTSTTSFGGTIHLKTIQLDKKTFSDFKTAFGSGMFLKNSIIHHVADNKNNLTYSFYLSRAVADGSVKGTSYTSNTYYFDFAKNLKKHRFNGFILGAPQAHQQRSAYEYHMATLGDYLKYGKNYNYNVGYLNNETMNWTENYFHKNLMQFEWNWQPNLSTTITTDLYASFGTGGGSYEAGFTPEYITPSDRRWRDPESGAVLWDKIIAYNQGETVQLADGNNYQRTDQNAAYQYINAPFNAGLTKIAFTNKHYWVGGKLKLNRDFDEHWKSELEYHYRYTHADNFDRLADLLGADGYMVFYDQNNIGKIYTQTYPVNILSAWNLLEKPSHYDKLHFHYQSDIALHDFTGKTTYTYNNLSGFAQFNINLQHNQRTDFFNYIYDNPQRVSPVIYQWGYSGLLGLKYNAQKNHWALVSGLAQKPNRFEQLFLNYKNDINPHLNREKAFYTELNYQYSNSKGFISINLYYTDWKNKYTTLAYENPITRQAGTAFLNDVKQTHLGLETNYYQQWTENLTTQMSLSVGNWQYKGKATGNAYDYTQNYIGSLTLDLNKVKVGNAAQVKSALSLIYQFKNQWEINLQEQYFGKLFSNLNMNQNTNVVLKLPSYFTTDLFIKSKEFSLHKAKLTMELAVENLLNTSYLIESATNLATTNSSTLWNGINTDNKVFFGPQRNWVMGLKLRF